MLHSRSTALSVLPANTRDAESIARRCRKVVMKRALVSASAAVVPIPGIDIAVDVGLIMKMLQEINEEFGLTPEQIELLAPKRRLSAYKAIAAVGSSAIGRAISREVVALIVKSVAKRLATKSTAKYVPLAGQAVAAGLSFAAIKFVGDRHIDDCVSVARVVNEGAAHRHG